LADMAMVRRVLALILAGSVLLLLEPAWRWTSADRLVGVSPDLALARNPGHPRALENAAARAFESGNDEQAVELGKAAIARRPLEARSYRVLAAAYERKGRLPEARAAHMAAIAVAPSDSVSQLWLASRYLGESRFTDALDHIDRALRARPDLAELVFPVVAGGCRTRISRPNW
jgi:tetratricopeptide (TPR) repeat protein